jgi:hypothetical protein
MGSFFEGIRNRTNSKVKGAGPRAGSRAAAYQQQNAAADKRIMSSVKDIELVNKNQDADIKALKLANKENKVEEPDEDTE